MDTPEKSNESLRSAGSKPKREWPIEKIKV